MTDSVTFIEYNPLYKNDFVQLNEEWISHYFRLEPSDIALFAHPETIVQNGGNIFFALYEEKAIGTVALAKETEERYEVTKMAVHPQYRGMGVGKKLLQYALDYARQHRFKYLYLVFNTKLTPAIKLYEQLGFRQIPLEENHYERGNYKAEMAL